MLLISYLQNVETDKDFQYKIRETRSLTNILPDNKWGRGLLVVTGEILVCNNR